MKLLKYTIKEIMKKNTGNQFLIIEFFFMKLVIFKLLATVLYNYLAKGIWKIKIVKRTDFYACAVVSAGHKAAIVVIRLKFAFKNK